MKCYDCASKGEVHDAVGVCHHCSVGLCFEHAGTVSDPITVHEAISRVVALPKRARLLLCTVCREALSQLEETGEPVAATASN